LLFRDYMHYVPEGCVFVNLFDIVRADPQEHFTRLFILEYLDGIPADQPHNGVCNIDDILQSLAQLGYSREHSESALAFLYSKGYCEGVVPGVEWVDVDGRLRITSIGAYHIRYLGSVGKLLFHGGWGMAQTMV